MASTYAYTTVADLEARTALDYEVLDSRYTDAVIDAVITQAERWVNEYCGQSFTAPISDGVVFATLEMAKYLMNKMQLEDGHIDELPDTFAYILQLCKGPLLKNKKDLTYSSAITDFDLRNLRG